MLLFKFFKGENVGNMFSLFAAGFSQHKVRVVEVNTMTAAHFNTSSTK